MGLKEYVGNGGGAWWRFILQVAVLPLVVLVVMVYVDVQSIKSSRWTDKDQHKHEQQHAEWERDVMLLLNNKVDRDDVPPPVVNSRLDRIESDIREIKLAINDIRREVRK